MMQRETYCSGAFLEYFYGLINKSLQDYLLNENERWISDLYSYLHGNCQLIIDLDDDEIVKRSSENPNYLKLWSEGRIKYESYPKTFDQMVSDDEYFMGKSTEIYLLALNETFCKNIEHKFGLVCTSLNSVEEKMPQLCQFRLNPVSKGRSAGWSFLLKYKFPSNAVVIADNYILDKRENISENLFRLLEAILPEELDIEYHLTILTQKVPSLSGRYELINSYLKKRYKYPIILSIGRISSGIHDLHDRNIISNYCWYNSVAGFDLFKETKDGLKSIHNTIVLAFPAAYVGSTTEYIQVDDEEGTPVQASYFKTLNNLKKIWNGFSSQVKNENDFMGEKKNRLLDY